MSAGYSKEGMFGFSRLFSVTRNGVESQSTSFPASYTPTPFRSSTRGPFLCQDTPLQSTLFPLTRPTPFKDTAKSRAVHPHRCTKHQTTPSSRALSQSDRCHLPRLTRFPTISRNMLSMPRQGMPTLKTRLGCRQHIRQRQRRTRTYTLYGISRRVSQGWAAVEWNSPIDPQTGLGIGRMTVYRAIRRPSQFLRALPSYVPRTGTIFARIGARRWDAYPLVAWTMCLARISPRGVCTTLSWMERQGVCVYSLNESTS